MTSHRRSVLLVPLALVVLTVLACTTSGTLQPLPSPTPTLAPLSPPKTSGDVDAEDALLIGIYRRANPAVVFIRVLVKDGEHLLPLGSGSGFVIDQEGHIVTNNHVVEEADALKVTFYDGSVADADVLGRDPYSDLAVIKVNALPAGIEPLEFGDSSTLQVGQRVIAIGNPFGYKGTMTTGIVSAVGRTLPAQVIEDAYFSNPEIIQTDAAVNPGNSGGPLLDSSARVVGVNTAIRSSTGVNSGIGFAVPVNTVKRVVPHLIGEGVYHYPYLGITAQTYFSLAELAEPLGLPVTRGVLVAEVVEGSAADRAGLRGGNRKVEFYGVEISAGGDIVVAIDGYELQDFHDLIAYLVRETAVGQTVVLKVIRGRETLEIPVKLGERP